MTDIRYAIRTLLRAPTFTAVAVLTLALGIGATTTMFSVVNAVLLKPLPYRSADRLVTMRGSLADLRDVAAASRSFDAIGMWASNLFNLRTNGDTQQVLGGQVSPALLPLLGVQPVLGRTFTEEDDRQETVILSYGLWQSRFGGDSSVVGRRIELSGTPYTVIGVAPAWFRFPSAEFQLWAPLGLIDRMPQQAQNRAFRIFSAVARLRDGVSLAQVRSDTQAISARLARVYPSTNEGVVMEVQTLYDRIVGDVKPALTILLATVGLLLLIASANVANLMLARTTVREREMAIRLALGAGRARLMRQLIVESLVLATIGGVAGMVIMMWGIDLLPAALEARLPRADGIRIDGVVLAFSLGATLLTGLFFGLAPALQTISAPAATLKESGRSASGSARGRRLRRAIVIGETGLAVIVLVGAGLLVRSFLILSARDPGFSPSNLLAFNVPFMKVPEAARAQTAATLIERLSTLPGVEAVGASTGLPPVTPQRATRFAAEGLTLTADRDSAYFIAATPDYFRTLRTAVLEGRAFDTHDISTSAPVAIINRTLATQLFPGGGAVGRRLRLINPEQSDAWRTVVGVVGDVHYRGLEQDVQPTLYTPFAQTPFMWLYVMVRTPVAPGAILPSIRDVPPAVHPALVAANARPMTELVAQTVSERRFNMALVSSFALIALILSAIGIYGVIAYSVAQRTHEIGVRIALGAARADVIRLVLGEGVGVATAGLALGLGGAVLLTRLMATLLFGITARDPLTYGAGAAVLLAVAAAASYIPARRATRVEPVSALRAE
jgi:putative ABC transport system permease protein